MLDVDALNHLSNQLERLYAAVQVGHYNAPTNRKAEKRKLLASHAAGQPYNPQFTYRTPPDHWERDLVALRDTLDPTADAWMERIHTKLQRTIAYLQALTTRDPARITAVTIAKHGLPTPELVAEAEHILGRIKEHARPRRTISAEDAAAAMRSGLEKAGLDDWHVALVDLMNSRMGVRGVQKQVRVRKGTTYSPAGIRRLLVHEVGTHVFRYANGNVQPLRLLRLGASDYLMTEEGMATYHEQHFGLQDADSLKRYALRVMAAHRSLTHSFYDVFASLLAHTNVDAAFNICVRAKRGFTDTAAFGAHVKDKVYLEGFLAVSRHLAAHPDDYPLLMSGRVSLAMLPTLKHLQAAGLLIPPPYLPAMLLDD